MPRGWSSAALFLVALIPVGARAAPQGVRLLPGGSQSVRFVIQVPEPELTAFDAPGTEGARRLEIEGYESTSSPGEPALPVRTLMVAVPPSGGVRVQALAVDPHRHDAVRLAPTPYVARGSETQGERSVPPRLIQPGGRERPQRGAHLLDVTWMRNQRLARIAVTPAEYDAAGRHLIVYGAIEVEVQMEGGVAGSLGAGLDARVRAEDPDPFEDVYRQLLVNYEQGKAWRSTGRGALMNGLRGPGRTSLTRTASDTSSVFVGRTWIKIPITQTGFYRVNFGQLRNLELFQNDTTTVLDSLRLFTWPGFPVLPEDSYCDSCDYREVAIGLSDNGDGLFNRNTDEIYFFALGASDWANLYEPTRPDTEFINNPYETKSYYYLTVSTADDPVRGPPARILTQALPVDSTGDETVPVNFQSRVHRELDVEYIPDATSIGTSYFWEKWFWRKLTAGGSFNETVEAPGIDLSAPARLRARLWGLAEYDTCSHPHMPDNVTDLTVNGNPSGRFVWDRATGYTIDTPVTALVSANNRIRIDDPLLCLDRIDDMAVAWFDVFYPHLFQPLSDVLTFDSAPGGGHYIYRIGPFAHATPPRVFDVTDAYAPREIVNSLYQQPDSGQFLLSFETVEAGQHRYRILPDAGIAKIATADIGEAQSTSRTNLRGSGNRADYLVMFFDGFKSAADSLVAWRQAHNGFEAEGVPISAVYDQFSGGRTDPAAIRNFLRSAYLNWSKRPTYVTFLGDASYDFKNLTGLATGGQPGSLVPSYENNFDFAVDRQFATDDWILNVNDPVTIVPDFLGGRIPAGDPGTALDIVRSKVLLYDRAVPLGEYRDRVMFIADDDKQGVRDDPLHWRHLEQTSQLDSAFTPQHLDRVYVYLHTYADGPGATKPGAKADIKSNINGDGVALFNYIGHGSPFKLADESVFLDTDVGTLTNATRLPLFVAASCDIGKYNDPLNLSLGERLLIRSGGGAIGVISATELAFSGQNAALNRDIYSRLFARDPSGRYDPVVSEALLVGKLRITGTANNQKYQLMGDAATRLNLPVLWGDIALFDSSGTVPVTELLQGQTITYRGQVLDRPNGSPVALSGQAAVLVEDSAPLDQAPDCRLDPGCDPRPFYYFRPGPIFRGDVAVTGGRFQGRFVVPLEARPGSHGRVRSYFEGRPGGVGAMTDGVGSIQVGIDRSTGPVADHDGPRITLSFPGGSSTVRGDAVLRVDLYDPSGILITGHTPQNRIVVTVDDNTAGRVDITPSFRYAADSYQSGTATFPLPDLPHGPHRIQVSAADNFAAGLNAGIHRSTAAIDFQVVDIPVLRISRAYLFPNPTRSGGRASGGQFVIDAPGDSVNVLLRIYTVSGRLIRTLKQFGGLGQIQMVWDGLDDEGEALSNGVYLFKVHLNARDEDGTSSAREEASTEGKFVIVAH